MPSTLYHYTSPDGLLAILKSSRLRLSDVAYLNDFSEGTYTSNLIHTIATGIAAEFNAKGPVSKVFEFLREGRYVWADNQPFAFCLTENRDQLSQWRGYADKGAGYSIGFDTKELTKQFDPVNGGEDRGGFFLSNVIYERKVQVSLVEKLLRAAAVVSDEMASQLATNLGALIAEVANWVGFRLLQHFMLFKDPAFSEEAEWRLVSLFGHRRIREKCEFFVRGSHLVPCLFFPTTATPFSIPITEIITGPSVDPELGKRSLEILAKKYDLPLEPAGILHSEVPLRF